MRKVTMCELGYNGNEENRSSGYHDNVEYKKLRVSGLFGQEMPRSIQVVGGSNLRVSARTSQRKLESELTAIVFSCGCQLA